MRVIYVLFLSLTSFTLSASPLLESKPEAAYFEKFQLIKAPPNVRLILKKGDRLAICGDSITEQKMYSRLMEDYLTMCVPQLKVSVRQYGWSGEKIPGFLSRMTNDCLRFMPTIATTCYGMNDFEYRPYENSIGQIYQSNSIGMIKAFKDNGVKVVLGSPGCVGKVPLWVHSTTTTTQDLNLSLGHLRNLDVEIAGKEKVSFADVFWPMLVGGFAGQQAYGTSYAISGEDGVHPHWAGHTIMAYAFLKALGLKGEIGTFTIDLNKNKMEVSDGHKVIAAKDGEYKIESSRYPFCPCAPENLAMATYPVCDEDELDSDNSIRSGMTLVPFNQELNRLILIVKHGTAEHYEITWGEETKTFTGTQLAAGINLALEFPANPFSAAFARVDGAVAAKQAYETSEMKKTFHGASLKDQEEITAHTDQVVGEAEKEHDKLVAAVHASFVPVTHVIKIVAQ